MTETLYSHHGGKPDEIPNAIRMPDGFVRTNRDTFTPEEIADAGYVEASSAPDYDPAAQHPPFWQDGEWAVNDKTTAELEAEEQAAHAGERASRTEGVNREHARRILEGRSFDVPGYGPVAPDGSAATQIVLLAQKDTARDLIAAGVTDPILMLTDNANVDHYLTPEQMSFLVDEGKKWMQAMHAAKRQLKTMEDIPADYASNESYWP
ncbi:DUF4376 domain-containing protein [Pararhizobium haloflavum]|uniref:DUF4376 domain-containing protein n=1 Tax=Pararhizobium haloflavum TaxID=2037914 RepID=UPI000C1965E4|nr:hypothetical protein [Pararhizobium haloflavum]